MSLRPYIVGNWKMHGTRAMLSEARAIDRAAQRHMRVEVALAPPYTLIHPVHREAEQIGVGAQDCHDADGGAHTGDISAAMIADAGFTVQPQAGHDQPAPREEDRIRFQIPRGGDLIKPDIARITE